MKTRRGCTLLASQFLRFTAVGAVGFGIDVAVLYVGLWAGLGFYAGRVASFLSAATFTWFANRHFTFGDHGTPAHAQWTRFLAANALGGVLNYMVYAFLIARGSPFTSYPALAVGIGAAAGLALNFLGSKLFVFRS